MKVNLFTALRHDLDAPVRHRIARRPRELLGVHIPLVGQHRLHHHLGTIAEGLHDLLVLDHDHQPLGVDIFDHALAGFEAVEAAVFLGHEVDRVDLDFVPVGALGDGLGAGGGLLIGLAVRAHMRAGVHQPVKGDMVAFGDAIVVGVMRAGDLDRARAELRVGVVVGDDRDQAAVLLWANRDFAEFPDNWGVTFI